MEKKDYRKIILPIVSLLILVIGVSFGFFITIILKGEGSKVDVQTAQIGGATVTTEGTINFGEADDRLPGFKAVSVIKVTATSEVEDININYNLIWNGKNTLITPISYYIYKSDNLISDVTATCEDVIVKDVYTYYSEECTISNQDKLGTAIETGTIKASEDTTKQSLLENNEIITATAEGKTVYYYIIFEIPNLNENQSYDFGGIFEGNIKADSTETSLRDTILASMREIRTETDFSTPTEEETTGVIYKEVVGDNENNITYYFRGAPLDNYVKFAGFYWRIIRINENGSIRMIYNGEADVIDALENKEEVLANGYSNYSTEYFWIGTSAFNAICQKAECVGFKYTLGTVHGSGTKSTILGALETWYTEEDNKLQNYEEYLDIDSGFCGDRSAYVYDNVNNKFVVGGGTGTTTTYYGAYIRLNNNNPTPTFECPNENDLYTVSDSSKGNKALTYPIGLITADEVAYAGGTMGLDASYANYYLNSGSDYTMSPSHANSKLAFVFTNKGMLDNIEAVDSDFFNVRPVINVRTEKLTISGSGTAINPYVIS